MKRRFQHNIDFSHTIRYISFGVLLMFLGIITTACQNVIIGDNSTMSIGNAKESY